MSVTDPDPKYKITPLFHTSDGLLGRGLIGSIAIWSDRHLSTTLPSATGPDLVCLPPFYPLRHCLIVSASSSLPSRGGWSANVGAKEKLLDPCLPPLPVKAARLLCALIGMLLATEWHLVCHTDLFGCSSHRQLPMAIRRQNLRSLWSS